MQNESNPSFDKNGLNANYNFSERNKHLYFGSK